MFNIDLHYLENDEFYATVNVINVEILFIVDLYPRALTFNEEHYRKKYSRIDFSKIDIILISDSRSYLSVNFIINFPEFKGYIITTQSNYRIGRNMTSEINEINNGLVDVIPISTRVIPLNFHQPYNYKEVLIIPVPNGCGLGFSNWIICKGCSVQLSSFKAFIITGYKEKSCFYPPYCPDKANTQNAESIDIDKPDVCCVLPSAISPSKCKISLAEIGNKIKECVSQNKKVLIPAYTDDLCYYLMRFLRFEVNISSKILYISMRAENMIKVVQAMPNVDQLDEIYNITFERDVRKEQIRSASIIITTHPIDEFGQVSRVRKVLMDNDFEFHFDEFPLFTNIRIETLNPENPYHRHYMKDHWFPINSDVSALRRFISKSGSNVVVIPDVDDLKELNNYKNYPFSVQLSDCYERFVNLIEHNKYLTSGSNSGEQAWLFKGEFKGERVEISKVPVVKHVINPPNMNQLINLLIEQGASKIKKVSKNRIEFVFDFVDNGSPAAIEIDDEEINIETENAIVEQVLASIISYEN